MMMEDCSNVTKMNLSKFYISDIASLQLYLVLFYEANLEELRLLILELFFSQINFSL